MRHKVYGKKLGLHKDQRDVLFKSLVHNLFSYGTIETTEVKAKAVKGLIDKIINLAKSQTSQRLIQSYFNNRELEQRLVKDLLPKFQNRVSGYTALVRLGKRLGDNTMMVKMSLIGAEKLEPIKKEALKVETKEVSKEKAVEKKASTKKSASKAKSVKG